MLTILAIRQTIRLCLDFRMSEHLIIVPSCTFSTTIAIHYPFNHDVQTLTAIVSFI